MFQTIKKYAKKIWLAILSLVLFGLPEKVFGQNSVQNGLSGLRGVFPGSINQVSDVNGLIATVIDMVLFITGAIAVVFLIYGGYLYITSAGNEENAEKGKKTIVNSLIGLVIVILSYVIVNVIVNLLLS
jgi:hypothetical protein